MSQPSSLSNSDIAQLYDILEEANKNYIKQTRTKDKPSFNILRVLSAMRLLYPQSPSVLYNTIIFITKNYDPQTHYQWKKAIEDLNANRGLFRSKSNYCRPEIGMHTRTYQNSFNRSRINDSQEHLQSKSYAQINIPHENTSNHESFFNEDQKDHSQTNVQTGKRMFYTKADSMSHISKNHYISFEPYRNQKSNYDKENVNSTNVQESRKKQSSYQYIEAIQRDLIRTAKQSQNKTPIDQSFIKKINSYESPYIYSKQEQEHDPIEEQMNARAKTFYQYSMQLKVFSSLQANSYVFLKAKENQTKAKLKHRSQLLNKGFGALVNNIQIQKDIRTQDQKANNFYKQRTQSKIFNLMKLMYDLHRNEVTPMDISKMKKGNYQFILALLFALHNEREEQMLGFNDKMMELIHSDQSNKLYLIVKYFGKHSWITEKNIEQLINHYKLSICQQVFTTLHREKEVNNKYKAVRQNNLKKQSFYALKLRWNLFACYKQKIKIAQAKRNKLLLHKIMKSLLETVFSTKLYSKRCEYIERKHLLHIKTNAFTLWIQSARTSIQARTFLDKKCTTLSERLSRLIKRLCFNNIRLKIRELDLKISKVIHSNIIYRQCVFFNRMRDIISHRHLVHKAYKSMESFVCKMAIQRWKSNSKRGKAVQKIIECIKINYFRRLVLPSFQYAIGKVREMHTNDQHLLRHSFLSLKRVTLQELQRRQTLQQQLKGKIWQLTKIRAIKAIKSYNVAQRKLRERQELSRKIVEYQKVKKQSRQQYFISKMLNYSQQYHCHRKKQSRLVNTLQQISQQIFMRRMHCLKSLRSNSNKVLQMVHEKRYKEASKIFFNAIEKCKIQKVRLLRKKNSSLELSRIMSTICKQQCKIKQIADNLYLRVRKEKAMQGLQIMVNKSKAITKIAQKCQMRMRLNQIKISLAQFRKESKVQKVHMKFGKKMFIESLRGVKQVVNKSIALSTFISNKSLVQFFQNLQGNMMSTKTKEDLNLKTIQCLKMRVMRRMQSYYIQNLVSKKHLYMAIKFRALKLCLNSFSAMMLKKQAKRPALGCHKLLAERLSTDLV